MAGLYLLGFSAAWRGSSPTAGVGLGRLLPGAAFLIFAISLRPACSAAHSAISTRIFPLAARNRGLRRGGATGGESALVWMKKSVSRSSDRARKDGKPRACPISLDSLYQLPLDEGQLFTRPEIAAAMKNFVLVKLYPMATDADSKLPELHLSKFNTGGDSLYAHNGPGRQNGRHFPGLTKDSSSTWLPAKSSRQRPQHRGRGCGGARVHQRLSPFHEIGGGLPRTRPRSREGRGFQLLGHLVASPAFIDPRLSTNCSKECGAQGVSVVPVSRWLTKAFPAFSPFLKKHSMEYPVGLGARLSTNSTTSSQLFL